MPTPPTPRSRPPAGALSGRLSIATLASLALVVMGCGGCSLGSLFGGGADASELPDLQKGIQTGLCEEVRGSRIPGADSHFFGELSLSGDTVSGSERWQLHANSAWKEKGGKDCTIRWRMTGMKVPVTTCGDCDFGLQLSGAPELNASDCPEGLMKKEAKPMDPKYDVKLQPDGSVFVYFAKSGRLAAEGYHADGAMNYRTQHQCKWF